MFYLSVNCYTKNGTRILDVSISETSPRQGSSLFLTLNDRLTFLRENSFPPIQMSLSDLLILLFTSIAKCNVNLLWLWSYWDSNLVATMYYQYLRRFRSELSLLSFPDPLSSARKTVNQSQHIREWSEVPSNFYL